MAVTAKDFKSQESYSDFSVNVKYLEPDLYELTINNYGNFYMSKGEFYKDEKYYFSYIPENEFEKASISVIKPKETVTIKVKPTDKNHKTNLEDGEASGFSQMAFTPRNDIVFVTGPYKVSFNKRDNGESKYNTLDIQCTTTEIKHYVPSDPDYDYLYSYIVSWTYENKEYCNVSSKAKYLDGTVYIPFDENVEIDPSKVTIKKIDSLIDTGNYFHQEQPSDCGGISIKYTTTETILMIVAVSFIGLGLLIRIFAFFFYTIRAIKRKRGKKNSLGQLH